jgi:uncharacterized protein (TIGR03382 family)
VILLLTLHGHALAAGNTYYVSLSGENGNDGLSEAQAWRTITHACAEVHAGDTVIIKPGDYGNENAEVVDSGTEDQPIIIQAETPGTVVLTGSGDGRGIYIRDRSYIIVEGIKFVNYDTGLNVRYDCTHITVRKCIFVENHTFGLLLYGTKSSPSNSHSHVFTQNEFYDYTDKQDYGIALYFSTNVKAVDNYFYGWHHQALSFKKLMFDSVAANNTFDGFRYTGIYLGQNEDSADEGILRCHNLIAEGNTFRPAASFRAKRAIMAANVTGAFIRGNFIEGHPDNDGGWGEGIGISESAVNANIYKNVIRRVGGSTTNPAFRMHASATSVKIFNNTAVNCAHSLGFEEYASVLFTNNVFYNHQSMVRGSDTADARNCTFEYNCVYPDWSDRGTTDISVDPLLAGPFDFLDRRDEDPRFVPDFSRAEACRLQSNSACINAGTHLTTTVGSGTGKDVTVADASYFTGGFNIVNGDLVRIGSNPVVLVVGVDYENNIITTDQTLAWTDGDGVSFSYSGAAPDMGAYEYIDEQPQEEPGQDGDGGTGGDGGDDAGVRPDTAGEKDDAGTQTSDADEKIEVDGGCSGCGTSSDGSPALILVVAFALLRRRR